METRQGIKKQPVSQIRWTDAKDLTANNYNPNEVFRIEMRLLKISLLENGWTQPIVVLPGGEIVDGYHRWLLCKTDKQIAKMTGGKVPVTTLDGLTRGGQMMSTIRHNRARGIHTVVRMAEIVRELIDSGELTRDEIRVRLGMEHEEIERLYDRGGMTERGSAEDFTKAWAPIEPDGADQPSSSK